MAIDKVTLDCLLNEWARFYLSEFNEVNWAKVSMSGKIIEAAELGIFARGTRHEESSFMIPGHIEDIVKALMELELKHQMVVKEEYTGRGRQIEKAKRLRIPLSQFKNRLCKARMILMKIL